MIILTSCNFLKRALLCLIDESKKYEAMVFIDLRYIKNTPEIIFFCNKIKSENNKYQYVCLISAGCTLTDLKNATLRPLMSKKRMALFSENERALCLIINGLNSCWRNILTPRELSIFNNMGQGWSLAQVAAVDGIAVKTVYSILTAIKMKMHAGRARIEDIEYLSQKVKSGRFDNKQRWVRL